MKEGGGSVAEGKNSTGKGWGRAEGRMAGLRHSTWGVGTHWGWGSVGLTDRSSYSIFYSIGECRGTVCFSRDHQLQVVVFQPSCGGHTPFSIFSCREQSPPCHVGTELATLFFRAWALINGAIRPSLSLGFDVLTLRHLQLRFLFPFIGCPSTRSTSVEWPLCIINLTLLIWF